MKTIILIQLCLCCVFGAFAQTPAPCPYDTFLAEYRLEFDRLHPQPQPDMRPFSVLFDPMVINFNETSVDTGFLRYDSHGNPLPPTVYWPLWCDPTRASAESKCASWGTFGPFYGFQWVLDKNRSWQKEHRYYAVVFKNETLSYLDSSHWRPSAFKHLPRPDPRPVADVKRFGMEGAFGSGYQWLMSPCWERARLFEKTGKIECGLFHFKKIPAHFPTEYRASGTFGHKIQKQAVGLYLDFLLNVDFDIYTITWKPINKDSTNSLVWVAKKPLPRFQIDPSVLFLGFRLDSAAQTFTPVPKLAVLPFVWQASDPRTLTHSRDGKSEIIFVAQGDTFLCPLGARWHLETLNVDSNRYEAVFKPVGWQHNGKSAPHFALFTFEDVIVSTHRREAKQRRRILRVHQRLGLRVEKI